MFKIVIFYQNIVLQGSFNLMNQFKMPFRNVQKRISVNAKTNKKKNNTAKERSCMN